MLRMNRFGGKIKVLTTVLTWLLILTGAIESIWGLCQVYGYTASNHSLYALTGSFYNPGPYSGFLAMCFPVCLHEWLKRGKNVGGYIALSFAFGGAYLLKKDSADGRLLIWKVAVQAIGEKPLTGYGWDYVAGAYGEAQEKYFSKGDYTEQEEHVEGLSDVALANVEAWVRNESSTETTWSCKGTTGICKAECGLCGTKLVSLKEL